MAVLGFRSAGMLSRRRARGKRVLPPVPPEGRSAAPVNNRQKYRATPWMRKISGPRADGSTR